MTNKEAIKWMKDAIAETDLLFDECSKELQDELSEQKEVFKLAVSALRTQENEGYEFCESDKPIKSFTYLPDCGLQYGTSVKAIFCPMCGRELKLEVQHE